MTSSERNISLAASAVAEVANRHNAPAVIPVGATTRDRCLADYSNGGRRLDLVAPGGGDDASLVSDPDCHPGRPLPTICQLTLLNPSKPSQFGYPRGIYGPSMSSPEVAATAAMIIASRALGRHSTPDQILTRLEQTAQPLGGKSRPLLPTSGAANSAVGCSPACALSRGVKCSSRRGSC